MLTRMQRIFIVISILILVLAVAVGAAYWYVQHQLSKLPVDNLEYQISGIGYKHIRLSQISFDYVEPAREIDALSSGFQSGEPDLQAPVALEDVFVTWQWHAFRPNLQIIEVGRLDVNLPRWPAFFTADSEPAEPEEWRIPDDWRMPQNLPHLVEVHDFILQLPCSDTCYYSGQVRFESQNKERLLREDEPQRSQFTLLLSPHQSFHEMEQINVHLQYEVADSMPSLGVIVQSPMAFNLEANHHIDNRHRLEGDLSMRLTPAAHWMFEEIWRWLPELEAASEPMLNFMSDTLTLQANYQSQLPRTSLTRWINEIEVDLTLEALLEEQLALNVESTLQRSDQIAFDGQINAAFLPGLRSNLKPFITQVLTTEVSSDANEAPYSPAFTPDNLLTQLDSPLSLYLDWALTFPPGTEVRSWPSQADGEVSVQTSSDSALTFEGFTLADLAAEADITFNLGLIETLDLVLRGALDIEQLEALNLPDFEPQRLNWSAHVHAPDYIDWQNLPLHLQVQSTGSSDISIDTQLRLDLADVIEHSSTDFSLVSDRGLIILRQPRLNMDTLDLAQIELRAPFAVQFDTADMLEVVAVQPATLNLNLHMPLEDEQSINLQGIQVEFADWRWRSPMTNFANSELSTRIDMNARAAELPGLRTINWRWFGSFAAQPMLPTPTYAATGRLTNSAGIVVRNQINLTPEQAEIDWQLADIFWLAGNPIAGTLDDFWPELLTLERGRTRAEGQLILPFNDTPLSLNAEVEVLDIAGVYDTISFSGLRSQLLLQSDGDSFSLQLADGYIQRLQYGMSHGPGELQLAYQGSLSAPLTGTLDIKDNRLSVLNGVISLLPGSYDLSQPDHTFYVDISQLDMARLLTEYPAADITGSGLLSGNIPVRWTPQGVFVEQGRIAALPPGGQLQYRSERAREMAQSNIAMGIVMNALDDFHYSELQGDVTYIEDGTLQLGLLIEGHNPALQGGRAVRLEITLQEDLPALLTSLQLANQLNEVIQERIQQRLIQGLRN